MITIQLTFPWGRYYAHPWGINPTRLREPEWPPSPWRLLRAIASAWFKVYSGQIPSPDCISLIESLGNELPDIGICKVTFGCTVHWQPNYGAASKENRAMVVYKNTRHENHFAALNGSVFFRWNNLEFSEQQKLLLTKLLANISYFGRSESLCHAKLIDAELGREIGWCRSTGGRKISSTCRDVFCPKSGDFKFDDLWSKRDDPCRNDKSIAHTHLVNKLLSKDMKADGSEWRSYQMPDGWPQKWVVRTPRIARETSKKTVLIGPKVAHYLCFSLQCRVPILPKFIVPLSEQFRDAANYHLCKIYGDGTPSFALFGHAEDRPADVVGDHQHAFYMPMAKQGDSNDFLSDLHIWCPYGFTQAEVEILLKIQRLNWGSGKYPVRLVLTALSKEAPADAPFATSKTPPARVWYSSSPFVPPRYFFRRERGKVILKEKDRPEYQLAECLKAVGVTTPGIIRRIAREISVLGTSWDIVRTPEGDDPILSNTTNISVHCNGKNQSCSHKKERRIGIFFEIEFDEPVVLPVPALGHSCHFGLGLFVPASQLSNLKSQI